MNDENLLQRITLDPRVMIGKPVIRGTRLTVEFILNLLAHGATIPSILDEYPGLEEDDVRASIVFATRSLQSMTFMPLTTESR